LRASDAQTSGRFFSLFFLFRASEAGEHVFDAGIPLCYARQDKENIGNSFPVDLGSA
jgi:hypothetical protein